MSTRFDVELELSPHNDIEMVSAGARTWRSTGDDPSFLCATRRVGTLVAGWYRVETDFCDSTSAPRMPQFYVDYGRGFIESDRVELPALGEEEFRRFNTVRFTHDVHALRFDPSAAPIEFSMSRMKLVRIGKIGAAYRLLRAVMMRHDSSISKWNWLKSSVGVLLRRGPKYWAEWMVNLYNGSKSPSMDHGQKYAEWIRLYDNGIVQTSKIDSRRGALISIILPVYNTPEKWLRKCIDSVRNQTYTNWELCVANDASPSKRVQEILEDYARADSRIKVKLRESNGHISTTSNDALSMASGAFTALLDHDDELPLWALEEVAQAIAANPDWRLIYSDEDKIDELGVRYDPYFKPDWNYDLLLTQNFISHLGIYSTSLLRDIGGFRKGLEGSQDWDLALRCVERLTPTQIGHIPRVLYHWRSIEGSTARAVAEKDYAGAAGLRAVRDHLKRVSARAVAEQAGPGRVRVLRSIPDAPPKVSLIVPTRDKLELLEVCVSSILEKTVYPNFELLIADNQSSEPETIAYFKKISADPRVSIIRYDAPFNYSAVNNYAARFATGDIIGLLNNDIEVESGSWLTEMVAEVVREDVGVVGAKLLYPDGTIQHAGVILGMHGVAGHVYAGKPRSYPGQMGRALSVQEFSAVTAACLLVRKDVFLAVGGLDEQLAVAFNDIDFCLRIKALGYRNIWTPHAVLFHHESASRGYEDTPEKLARFNGEVEFMHKRWGDGLHSDPAYNRNLCLSKEPFELSFPPRN